MISATPKKASEQKAMINANAKDTIEYLCSPPHESCSNHHENTLCKIKPTTTANTKNNKILNITTPILTELSAIPVTNVKQIIPKTSSITAAARIAFPLSVDIHPISFNVSTVIPTLVAVKITPKNKLCNHASGPTL